MLAVTKIYEHQETEICEEGAATVPQLIAISFFSSFGPHFIFYVLWSCTFVLCVQRRKP
jgi:hypothetical protein